MKNNEKSTVTVKGGIGFIGLLTIAFIVLKLCNVINWSWIWVLSPIWISAIPFVIMLIALIAMYIRYEIIKWRRRK